MGVTIGRIVRYILSEQDAEQINRRRVAGVGHGENWPAGAQAHVGNQVVAGDEVPMIVTAVFEGSSPSVNGKCFLDGNDSFWATSRPEGTGRGMWSWPVRQK